MTKWGALVQYHFKIDPDTLTVDQLAKYVGRLIYALKSTGQWKEK